MALDLGTKTIGVAISDAGRRLAQGLKTIRRTRFARDADELLKVAAHYQVGAIVLGLPLNMNGSFGPRVQATRAFAKNLAARTPIPIVFEDERLSTVEASELLAAATLRRSRHVEHIDAAAAEVILRQALARLPPPQN